MEDIYSSKLDLDRICISLYYFRVLNNFLVKQISKYLSICPTQYLQYENGYLYTPLPTLDILTQIYLVSFDDLLYPDPNKFNQNILKDWKKRKNIEYLG